MSNSALTDPARADNFAILLINCFFIFFGIILFVFYFFKIYFNAPLINNKILGRVFFYVTFIKNFSSTQYLSKNFFNRRGIIL